MSYKKSLDAAARARHVKKLELVGLRTYTYELGREAWIDDATLWPPVGFPDIVLYLLQTLGLVHSDWHLRGNDPAFTFDLVNVLP